jgi:hypothetical protein
VITKLIVVCGEIGAYCRYAIHCPGLADRGNKKPVPNHTDARLVFRAGDRVLNGRHVLAILIRILRRAEIEGQLVNLARELERTIVAIAL